MKVSEFFKEVRKELKPSTELDFMLIKKDGSPCFLDVDYITMSYDVDDPRLKNAGAIVLREK